LEGTITGPEDGGIRAGSSVLELLANPLILGILEAHAESPRRLAELQKMFGWFPRSTLRTAVAKLESAGALRRQDVSIAPHAAVSALTPAGEEMRFAATALEEWLGDSPNGAIMPGSEAAQAAILALTGGWSSTLMLRLASRPFTLTELDRLIPDVSGAALARRLAKMRRSGQIEALEKRGRSTPYVVTNWLRRSIAPLCVAGRYERRHLTTTTAPITKVEVEAAFTLAVPLVRLATRVDGECALGVLTAVDDPNRRKGLSGVTVEVRGGRAVSCEARIEGDPSTWALGSAENWLDAVIDGDPGSLRSISGPKRQLARELVRGIHLALFGED